MDGELSGPILDTGGDSTVDRKKYTEAFKHEAVRLARERGNLSQTARELGIHETVLQRWKKRLETVPEEFERQHHYRMAA